MRKGTDLIDKAIIAYDTGRKIARIQDLIFDQNDNQLLGFLIKESGLFRSAKVIPMAAVKAIGLNAIVVADDGAIVSATEVPQIHQVLERDLVLKGTRVLTTDGRYLGSVVDLYFDDRTGKIEGYEASGGLFADAYSGRSFIPAPYDVKIGEEITFVPPAIADLMAEQVGGVLGVAQTASSRLQETSEVANQKIQEAAVATNAKIQQGVESANIMLQEAGVATNAKIQQGVESANIRLQDAANGASDRFAQGSRTAATAVTNGLIDPAEQLVYVVGKPLDRDVATKEGTMFAIKDQVVTLLLSEEAQRLGILDRLYRATGGMKAGIDRRFQDATDRVETHLQGTTRSANTALSNTLAWMGVERAKGRRAQRLLRDENGSIIVAPGQIVTDMAIERAKVYGREAALLDAVGLQPSEAARYSTKDAFSRTGTKFQEEAAIAQENASILWQNLKEKLREAQGRGTRAFHQKRIEQALGRPVTRVILDPQDNIILNVGELITHRAIQQAERGGVLNILLNSVYMKQPNISETELRAADRGIASLDRDRGIESKQRVYLENSHL